MIEITVIILVLIIVLFVLIYYPFFSSSSQILGEVIFRKFTDKKVVALTFDDGPNEPYTSQILDVLKKYNIKATFFPVGENIVREKVALKRIADEGHIIGIHSYSHAFFAPIISPAFKKEIKKSQDLIQNITGQKPTLFRPPWFLRSSAMLKTAQNFGLTTITGVFGSRWELMVSSKKIAHDAIKHTSPGVILVFHDGYNNKKAKRNRTVEAIAIVIPQLLKAGYKFVTVPQLLDMA